MAREEVTLQREAGVAVLTVAQAPRDAEGLVGLMEALAEACAEIAAAGGANVVVIAGGPAALDLGSIAGLHPAPEEEGAGRLSLAQPLAGLGCPVLAALQGPVTGEGLELALACDIRLAAEGASFSLPQLRTGLMPCDGGTQRLARIVGKAKALEMILTGQAIDAREADRIGLVNRLFPPGELLPLTMEMARKMALQAPLAMSFAKEAICHGLEMNLSQGLRLEADLYFLLHTTQDRREGITAFQEKRTPHFEGR